MENNPIVRRADKKPVSKLSRYAFAANISITLVLLLTHSLCKVRKDYKPPPRAKFWQLSNVKQKKSECVPKYA